MCLLKPEIAANRYMLVGINESVLKRTDGSIRHGHLTSLFVPLYAKTICESTGVCLDNPLDYA